MRTTLVTGSSGGMGVAIRRRLESKGQRVIGADIRDAEITADLATAEGRGAMIEEAARLCEGKLDGVVAAAGVADHLAGDLITSINYFGAVATLEGLRPMLARSESARAVAVSSNSIISTATSRKLNDLCLAGDEGSARALALELGSENSLVYGTAKLALARWVRQRSIESEWIGRGISLNAIVPGLIRTPLNSTEHEEAVLKLGDIYPIPAGRVGTAEEIAALVDYLLSEEAGFLCGSLIFIDGGTEAALRHGDWPTSRALVD